MKKSRIVALLLAAGLAAQGAHAALAVEWSGAAEIPGDDGTVLATPTLGDAFTLAPGHRFRVTVLGAFDGQYEGKGDGSLLCHQVGL